MTIHDELILRLIEPDKSGKATGYITEIVGSKDIRYTLEDTFWWRGHYEGIMKTFVRMSPDIVVHSISPSKTIAVELESDKDWDFGHSLRQIRKYKRNSDFQEVVVVIPKKYERFAILYSNQGFKVYLWKATRLWECDKCGEGPSDNRPTKCKTVNCKGELELKGIKDVEFMPFEPTTDKT
jgi:translation initiation factor IF-1